MTKATSRNSSSTKSQGKKGGMSMIAAGAAGTVVGAVIGGATAAALSNRQTRKKIGDVINNIGEYANEAMTTAEDATSSTGTSVDTGALKEPITKKK